MENLNVVLIQLESCKEYKEKTQSQVLVILAFVLVAHRYIFRLTSKR